MNETDTTAIFWPVWRRKWSILFVAIVVAAATYVYYKGATPLYLSTTQVYLGASAEEQVPGEKKTPAVSPTNQAAIINSLIVPGVRLRLRAEHNLAAAKGVVHAKASEKSPFITISSEAHQARSAALLANEVAKAYVKREHVARLRGINTAIAIARRQLRKIELASTSKTPPKANKSNSSTTKGTTSNSPSISSVLQGASLSSRINQLEAQLLVQGAQHVNIAKPGNAQLLSPKPRKNAIFGFLVGLVLAAVAAYALARFDRRLRSLDEIETLLKAPILTALPAAKRPIVRVDGQPRPSKVLLEPLRRLHTNLQLSDSVKLDQAANGRLASTCRIVFISADSGDGKSTIIAGLGLVQRDAGARVVLIDANLRRPVLAKLLGAGAQYGLAEVLGGNLAVDEAMQSIESMDLGGFPTASGSSASAVTAVKSRSVGSLSLVASGDRVANPPALLGSEAMVELLGSFNGEFDYVLIDAISPLEVSDVMPLLPVVDGIVIVSRVGHTRETSTRRLMQQLAQSSAAPVLGVAANCVSSADIARYGFSSSDRQLWRRTLGRR
jgi:tyrosine-protein kinase